MGLAEFDLLGVGELAPIIRQDAGEQPVERLSAKDLVQCIDDADDGTRCIGIPQECQHETALDEMHRQQALASHTPDHAVHLDDGRLGIRLKEFLKIGIIPPDPASSVHLEFRLFVTWTVLDLAGQIDVPDIEELGIDVIIQRLLAAHQVIHMVQVDLVQGLPVAHKGTDDPIDPCDVILI